MTVLGRARDRDLPAHQRIHLPTTHIDQLADKPRPVGLPLAGLHVLVVDDDPDARDLFRVVLVYYGAAASAVSTARAALDALQRLHADVVLTDVVLGDSDDGIWLLRQAHSRWPELALIAISGSEVRADVRTNLGFVKYLMKPTQPELLVDAVLVAIAQAARRASAAPQSLALFQPR